MPNFLPQSVLAASLALSFNLHADANCAATLQTAASLDAHRPDQIASLDSRLQALRVSGDPLQVGRDGLHLTEDAGNRRELSGVLDDIGLRLDQLGVLHQRGPHAGSSSGRQIEMIQILPEGSSQLNRFAIKLWRKFGLTLRFDPEMVLVNRCVGVYDPSGQTVVPDLWSLYHGEIGPVLIHEYRHVVTDLVFGRDGRGRSLLTCEFDSGGGRLRAMDITSDYRDFFSLDEMSTFTHEAFLILRQLSREESLDQSVALANLQSAKTSIRRVAQFRISAQLELRTVRDALNDRSLVDRIVDQLKWRMASRYQQNTGFVYQLSLSAPSTIFAPQAVTTVLMNLSDARSVPLRSVASLKQEALGHIEETMAFLKEVDPLIDTASRAISAATATLTAQSVDEALRAVRAVEVRINDALFAFVDPSGT